MFRMIPPSNKQILNLHSDSVDISKRLKRIEALIENMFSESCDEISATATRRTFIRNNIKEMRTALNRQQELLFFMLNGQLDQFEASKDILIDELNLSNEVLLFLKRNGIFSIKALITFLGSHSLTELKSCGTVKAEKVEKALKEHLKEQKRRI